MTWASLTKRHISDRRSFYAQLFSDAVVFDIFCNCFCGCDGGRSPKKFITSLWIWVYGNGDHDHDHHNFGIDLGGKFEFAKMTLQKQTGVVIYHKQDSEPTLAIARGSSRLHR
jgi:hypothetical protein